MQDASRLSRREVLRLFALGGGAVLLTACGAGASGVPSAMARKGYLYLSVMDGGMIGKPGWPTFVPGDFAVPANATVQCEIRCFDDGAAPVPSKYAKVTGTVGNSMVVIPSVEGALSAKGSRVSAMDASKVSHTLTVESLGINVPMPPSSTVRFQIKTGAGGRYTWRCMAPCGTGKDGMGGTMAASGWMTGTMTVQT